LRVLQDQEIRPVGGTQTLKVDARIVTATNKDLEAEIAAGRFREDLYYRLNVIPIYIPPLRERPEDIPPLVDAFVRKHSAGERRLVTQAAMERLKVQPWRGNARELENVIERAMALSDASEIGPDDLPFAGSACVEEVDPATVLLQSAAEQRMTLRELEERYIDQILRSTGGNKVQAAKLLGIDRKTLYRRAERSEREHGAAASAAG
jgi:DNA-binding NtrC family response regulator